MAAAWRIGQRRNKSAGERGAKHLYGYEPDSKEESNTHAESAVSEAMVAEATGRRWLSVGDERDAGGEDVEGGIGVRWSPLIHGSLIIHPEDLDHLKMALVTGNAPNGIIRGWYWVGQGKKPEWWRSDVRWPAFFVPQGVLQPISLLALTTAVDTPVAEPQELKEVHPYCKPHTSHFCPCCKPHLYDPTDPEDRKKIQGWRDIAPIVTIGDQ